MDDELWAVGWIKSRKRILGDKNHHHHNHPVLQVDLEKEPNREKERKRRGEFGSMAFQGSFLAAGDGIRIK